MERDRERQRAIDYMQSGAFALMRNAARYRDRWLRDFYTVGKDAVRERGGCAQKDAGREGEGNAILRWHWGSS